MGDDLDRDAKETGTPLGSRLRGQLGAVAVGLLLSAGGCHTTPASEDRQGRVERFFDMLAADVAAEHGLTAIRELRYGMVATLVLPDGTKVSLWATEPETNPTIQSTCFYLDQETTDGAGGSRGCSGVDQNVTLNRDGPVLFGSIGNWPANQLSLSGGDVEIMVDIVNGHFLAPPSIAAVAIPYRLTLFGAGNTEIGTIDSFVAPGSAVPIV